MANHTRLTPVEWEIMEAVWELGGSPSVRDVMQHAYPNGEKAYTTVQTIMNTLEKKGLLTRKKIGLVNFYAPTQSRQKIIKAELRQMASRMFQGSVPALANYLIDTENLDLKEIEEIKTLLQKKEDDLRSNKP